MAFPNPVNASEILYGTSGDVRNEINSYASVTTLGHYADETELPGALIVAGLRKATRLINVYLEPVYADQIPFQNTVDVPVMLDEIASDIATYYTLRSSAANLGKVTDDKKKAYYDDYVNPTTGVLVMISQRKIQLPELSSASPFEGKSIRQRNRHPVFDINNETGAGPDPNLIQDIESERGT